jgi:hypothetical protein
MSEPFATQDLNADTLACAAWVARFLKSRGVDRIFGLQGGHIQPIWDHVAQLGIRIVDVRDEGAAVHMAHAHAELVGGFGVAMATAGPGVTNTVTAIANASLARASVSGRVTLEIRVRHSRRPHNDRGGANCVHGWPTAQKRGPNPLRARTRRAPCRCEYP